MALPDHLADLASLFDEWSTDDVARRVTKIIQADDDALRTLAERILPRAEEIDAYLSTLGSEPLAGAAKKLVLLAECALEAETELEARNNPDPIEE